MNRMNRLALKLFLIISSALVAVSCSGGKVKLEMGVIDSVYVIDGIEYSADYCKMQVLEDPQNKSSKVIDIPVIRIRSKVEEPGAPVFILNDGPGLSNFTQSMPTWLVENQDVVIIGYRGVDGSVSLHLPELNNISLNSKFLSETNIELAGKTLKKGLEKLSDSLELDLKQYNTLNMAYDIESARQAFQYNSINIYAVGYGARIAQAYAGMAPNTIFRMMLERPKAKGVLALAPKYIDDILRFYDSEAEPLNSGRGFVNNIIEALDKLPSEHNGHVFDKDRIVYSAFISMKANNGAALVNEAFASSLKGDYEGLKYLDEMYSVFYPAFNLGDYAVKCMTSDFDSGKDYVNEFSYGKSSAFGSPLSKFIFGAIQKSDMQLEILPDTTLYPGNVYGQCLIINVNLDLESPMEPVEFGMKDDFAGVSSLLFSDYNAKTLHTFNIDKYSELISNFLVSGVHEYFVPEYAAINLVPEKTLKQLSLERIQ